MANLTSNLTIRHCGEGGRRASHPCDAAAHLYAGGCLAMKPFAITPSQALTFAEVGGTGDTITRADGSWITDGLAVGDVITVSGTSSNNVTGAIASLSATVITMGTTDLAAETPAAGAVTVAADKLYGLVPLTTALGGHCIGVCTSEIDNSAGLDDAKRGWLETDRVFLMPNGSSTAAFADTDPPGMIVYASDDHTASRTVTSYAMGFFRGLDSDGLVRVYITASLPAHMAALAS
jgi:hypothetical protein